MSEHSFSDTVLRKAREVVRQGLIWKRGRSEDNLWTVASTRTGKHHRVRLYRDHAGTIDFSTCSCQHGAAALGHASCYHVAAVLMHVEDRTTRDGARAQVLATTHHNETCVKTNLDIWLHEHDAPTLDALIERKGWVWIYERMVAIPDQDEELCYCGNGPSGGGLGSMTEHLSHP